MQLLNYLRDTLSRRENPPASATIPPSDAYSILENERRRHIVEYLATHEDDEVSAGEIADHLSSLGDDRSASYVSIIQQHAPRMESSGFVTYDDRQKTLTPCESLDTLYEAHKEVEAILR